jgi:hypothetical protein
MARFLYVAELTLIFKDLRFSGAVSTRKRGFSVYLAFEGPAKMKMKQKLRRNRSDFGFK